MAYGVVNADKMTTSDGVSSSGLYGFKNRIINGAMMIDQRATSVTSDNFTVDRWKYSADSASKATVAQDTTAPTGFINSLKVTSSSAYSVPSGDTFKIQQSIEGLNIADLGWGTASATAVTLSFWVRSSLTGTFGGALRNSGGSRSYPFTYTISAANTFEYKTITIAGDTSGTWLTTNGIGIQLNFGLAVGSTFSGTAGAWAGANYISATGATSVLATNGATFYITGVQLEKGSTATSFDYRPYGTELALCQRYYQVAPILYGSALSTTGLGIGYNYPVIMRANPTAALLTSTPYAEWPDNVAYTASGATLGGTNRPGGAEYRVYGFSGFTLGRPIWFQTNQISLSAEL